MRFLLALAASSAILTAQTFQMAVKPAKHAAIPFQVDGNSPSFWRDGVFRLYTSTDLPVTSTGTDQFSLNRPVSVLVDRSDHLPMWIESVWQDEDGTVYGWYHHEPRGLCPGNSLTAPQIGAVVSYDGGSVFFDLGIVLSSADPIDCKAANGFFGSGHGDFSVVFDQKSGFFYYFFTSYGGSVDGQGIAIARMAFEDRKNPAGAVWKFFQGDWTEPGIEGRLTPVFRAETAWQREDADSFWGPAVHWNSEIEAYVILLNHACCRPNWPQEGIYVSFAPNLAEPQYWQWPQRIPVDAREYYPQVIGLGPGETDSVVGKTARLYIHGTSLWEVEFSRVEDPGPPEPRIDTPENPDSPDDYLRVTGNPRPDAPAPGRRRVQQ